MQWFLGINEGCPAFKQYGEMARVAIFTALKHTSLRPHCLYDGGENEFTQWLRDHSVPIIQWQTFLYDDLARLSERRNDPALLAVARGVFLRAELPVLQARLGLEDRVLYTDCDVIFQSDVVDSLLPLKCKYFALAVESDRKNHEEANTGVMWMHLPEMLRRNEEFRTHLRENIDLLPGISWDQGAYRNFYRSPLGARLWDELPPELNWKPYWEDYRSAKIIHFHGPKPFQRKYIDSHYPELKYLTGGCYEELCEIWEQLLREAE